MKKRVAFKRPEAISFVSSLMQLGFGISDGASDLLCDFPVLLSSHVVQNEHCLVTRGELGDCLF